MYTLASLCTYSLRGITLRLWSDDIYRLSGIGCPALTTRLKSSTLTVRHHINPPYSMRWPSSFEALPNLTSFTTKWFKIRPPPKFNLAIDKLPQSITTISLSNRGCLRAFSIAVFENKDILPLIESIIIYDDISDLTDVMRFVSQRKHVTTVSIQGFEGPGTLVLDPSYLPQKLSHLGLSCEILCVSTNPSEPSMFPPNLSTLVIKVGGPVCEFLRTLPQSLTKLAIKQGSCPGTDPFDSSLLPRSLQKLKLGGKIDIPHSDDGGFFSSLPPSMTKFTIRRILTEAQYNLLPLSLRMGPSRMMVFIGGTDNKSRPCSQMFQNARPVPSTIVENPPGFSGVSGMPFKKISNISDLRRTSMYKELSNEILNMIVSAEKPNHPNCEVLDQVHTLRIGFCHPSVRQSLNFPRRLKRLTFSINEEFIDSKHPLYLTDDEFSSLPTSLKGLNFYNIWIPDESNLHRLKNLVHLVIHNPGWISFDIPQLPQTLKNLEISIDHRRGSEYDVSEQLLSLISNLPPSLVELQFASDSPCRGVTDDHLLNLPRGLVALYLPSCPNVFGQCLPFLPKYLLSLTFGYTSPSWCPHLGWNRSSGIVEVAENAQATVGISNVVELPEALQYLYHRNRKEGHETTGGK